MASERRKIVLVGDSDCGKTTLLQALLKHNSVVFRKSTTSGVHLARVQFNGKTADFELYDTASCRRSSERVREFIFSETDAFVVLFAVDNVPSMENAVSRWGREVRQYCPRAPVILVGNKTDARNLYDLSSRRETVLPEDGWSVASCMGAYDYLECSARDEEGLVEILQTLWKVTKPSFWNAMSLHNLCKIN